MRHSNCQSRDPQRSGGGQQPSGNGSTISAVLVEEKNYSTAASTFCALGFPPFASLLTITHWLWNKCGMG